MASREKKQIASKQFTCKKECQPFDKSTESLGGKTVTSEKKKEPLKKLSNQNQHTAKKNSRTAKSNHVTLKKTVKTDDKNLNSQEKNLLSPAISKCKTVAKKQTGSGAKCKQNTKEPSDLQFNVKFNLGPRKKSKSDVTRPSKGKVMGNLKSKTSMENVADQDSKDLLGLDETTFVNQLFATSVSQKRTQNTKFKRKYKKQISSGSVDVCNGVRNRSTPYLTRSDSPIRVLRNGKRRKLKDPSMFDGLDSIERAKKRRRIASVTKEGTTESDSSIYETIRTQAESDGGSINSKPVCDSELNGEGSNSRDECTDTCSPDTRLCRLQCDDACVQNVTINGQCVRDLSLQEQCETKVTENISSVEVNSTNCNVEDIAADNITACHNSDVKKGDGCSEYNLGKTISNRIAELIKRSKIGDTRRGSGSDDEGVVVKQEHLFSDDGTVSDTSQKQMDSNSNLCESCDITKPCILAGEIGADVEGSKDNLSSYSNTCVVSELDGSSQVVDVPDSKVAQPSSDGASNSSEAGNLLELNFSEVRAAISKKIQNCAKENSSGLKCENSVTVSDVNSSTPKETLAQSKELNTSTSIYSESAGPVCCVSEKCKSVNCDSGPVNVKSPLLKHKVESCKRASQEIKENYSSCPKKPKMLRKPTGLVKKLLTSPSNKCDVDSNKKSDITKINTTHSKTYISVGDLAINAVDAELSCETGSDENLTHCGQQDQKMAMSELGKCPCPDKCNNHITYSCDVLKSNGVNSKITHESETVQSERSEILKMIDVFEFRDDSDELSNQVKLMDPTILTDHKDAKICETEIGTHQKQSLDDQKCLKVVDSNSSINSVALNVLTVMNNSIAGEGTAGGFDIKLETDLSRAEKLIGSSGKAGIVERVTPDICVVDTLNELLTLASEMNDLKTVNRNGKNASDAVDNSRVCAQNHNGELSEEAKSSLEKIEGMESLQTENCGIPKCDKKYNGELTSSAVYIGDTSQTNDQECDLLHISVVESGSISSQITARSSKQETTLVDSLNSKILVEQIAKCGVTNGAAVENTSSSDNAENNDLYTRSTSAISEKTLVTKNESALILQSDENEKHSNDVVTDELDSKCVPDQVSKLDCKKEKIMDNSEDHTFLNVPNLKTSENELEIVLKDVLNDVLARVEILLEGVFEEKTHLREIRGMFISDGEVKNMHNAKDESRNLFENVIQEDKLKEPLKSDEDLGKSILSENKLSTMCTENATAVHTCKKLSQLIDENIEGICDAGCNLKSLNELGNKPKNVSPIEDTDLSVADELGKLALICPLERDHRLQGITASVCEVQCAAPTTEILKEESENACDQQDHSKCSTSSEPTEIHMAGTDKGVSSNSMDMNDTTTSLEQSNQNKEDFEGVEKKDVKGVQFDSVVLNSQEIFQEYKEIEKLEEVNENGLTLDQFFDGKPTECSDDGGAYNCTKLYDEKQFEEESPEDQAVKESILSALGLQSLRAARAAAAAAATAAEDGERDVISYTGTLKTVIKVSRSPEKKNHRVPMRSKKVRTAENAGSSTDDVVEEHEAEDLDGVERIKYSICSESTSSEVNKSAATPEQGLRKSIKLSGCHRPQNDVGTQVLGEKDVAVTKTQDDDGKPSGKQDSNLIIPEKSSSFSIHPQRLCSDVCSYCFGKFGSLDTPCHIAQLKSSERQRNILSIETHLTADSCLCDACYRHVDRKANCPSYKPNRKRQHRSDDSHPKSLCCVQECSLPAYHTVRRKWLLKLKRSIAKKVPIDMEKMPPHLPFPLCSQHYYWVDFFMVCGVCKRKLTRNHMYPLGSEVNDLNKYLIGDGIPVHLTDKIFLCKLCRYFCTLRLKHKDPSQLTGNHKMFFDSYRKRILHYNDIEVMDSDEVAEPIVMPSKSKRRKTKDKEGNADAENGSKVKNKNDGVQLCAASNGSVNATSEQQQKEPQVELISIRDVTGDTNRSGANTPLIDYSTLDTSAGTTTINIVSYDPDTAGRSARQRTAHSSGSFTNKPFYPGSEELPLQANFDFHNRPRDEGDLKPGEWDKCTANIQFDKQTKKLFQQLQRPYGNHSSFFRHLILLEKYWRSGDLALTPNASQRAVNYVTSVTNRINSFEGHSVPLFPVPSATAVITTASSVPVIDLPLRRRLSCSSSASQPVIMTSQGMTFTAVSSVSAATTSTSSVSCTPIFSSMPLVSSPSPTPLFTSPVPGSFLHGRRVPNVLQVTAGGKSFSIVPNMVQIKQLQALHRKQQLEKQRRERQVTGFVPLITDVRSLATDSWEQKNLTKANAGPQRQSKMSVTILPKPTPKIAIPALRPGVKPSTVVTPTGIILSKTPELSVIAMPPETTVPVLPAVKSDTPGS